jgi:hypothetical protein
VNEERVPAPLDDGGLDAVLLGRALATPAVGEWIRLAARTPWTDGDKHLSIGFASDMARDVVREYRALAETLRNRE